MIIESFNAIGSIKAVSPQYIGDDVVKYLVATRGVHFFNIEKNKREIPSWGMYIVPPVLPTLCTGDLLRVVVKNADYSEETSADKYRVIITPACDLANNKVKKVMLLPCNDKICIINAIKAEIEKALSPLKTEENQKVIDEASELLIQKRLTNSLNSGSYQKWGALPAMKGLCPLLSVNLKDVEVKDPNKIALCVDQIDEETEFVRVASIDSPYVSQLVWAFMQNVCRPGVPSRNVELWANEY